MNSPRKQLTSPSSMWAGLSLLLLWPCLISQAQAPATNATPPITSPERSPEQVQVSPAAALREAMRPVEVTHASIPNWSGVEQASLAVAIKQASVACAARKAADYIGGDLVDLGRLCALGLAYPSVIAATGLYIHEQGTEKPRLVEAYAVRINAELTLKDEASAYKDAMEMLSAGPYTALAASATDQALDYMHLLYTADAVSLATERQPMILSALQLDKAARATLGKTAIPIAELYRQGLALAELQQLQANSSAAHDTVAALDAVLPPALMNDDATPIQGMRLRYAQLGMPLATIPVLASLNVPAHTPVIPAHRAITALLLFPDWCVQCVRLAKQIPDTAFTVEGHRAYAYGLLAQTMTPRKMPQGTDKNGGPHTDTYDPAFAAEYLHGTPTLTVPPTLLDAFNASELPLLIVVDSHSIVRLFDVVGETALQPGDMVDSAIALIGKQWPATGETALTTHDKNHPAP